MSNSNEPPFLPGGDEIYDGEDLNAKQVAKDARALLSSVETLINTGQVEPKRQVGDMKSGKSDVHQHDPHSHGSKVYTHELLTQNYSQLDYDYTSQPSRITKAIDGFERTT